MIAALQMPEGVTIENSSEQSSAKFIMQPLEEGYGVTIGNALRRVLLSSTPGAAIIGLSISGVFHEFQTIPGVIEDMTEIILNLKEVRFKILSTNAPTVSFKIKGSGSWTAQDIQNASPEIEVLNLNHHIASLADDAEFDVELRLGKGRGYVPAEEQNTADFPVGMMAIDAIHTPIKNVVYTIQPFRVGQKTDYEQLTLDVHTDGTITPQEAVENAAVILQEHLAMFGHFKPTKIVVDEKRELTPEEEARIQERNRIRRILFQPVEELELSVRAHNCLKAANIGTLAELVQLTEQDLLKFRNFGRKSLNEMADIVKENGLQFGMNIEDYRQELTEESTAG